jgi:hypothetical protein
MRSKLGVCASAGALAEAARAGAAAAGARARLGAGTAARIARVPARHADLGGETVRRLLERDLHAVAQVGAAIHAAASAAGRAEDVAEDVAERVGETAEALRPGAAAAHAVRIDTRVTEAVVCGALGRVGEDLVGLLGFLELVFGVLRLVTLVAVRVVLHGELAVRLLDVVLGRVLRHAEHFVVIPFRHVPAIPLTRKRRGGRRVLRRPGLGVSNARCQLREIIRV